MSEELPEAVVYLDSMAFIIAVKGEPAVAQPVEMRRKRLSLTVTLRCSPGLFGRASLEGRRPGRTPHRMRERSAAAILRGSHAAPFEARFARASGLLHARTSG